MDEDEDEWELIRKIDHDHDDAPAAPAAPPRAHAALSLRQPTYPSGRHPSSELKKDRSLDEWSTIDEVNRSTGGPRVSRPKAVPLFPAPILGRAIDNPQPHLNRRKKPRQVKECKPIGITTNDRRNCKEVHARQAASSSFERKDVAEADSADRQSARAWGGCARVNPSAPES